jgi:thiol:disulfide interchange protein
MTMSLLYGNLVFFALGLGFTISLAVVTLICSTAIGKRHARWLSHGWLVSAR